MPFTELVEFARSQRGQGWLGAIQIVDIVDRLNIPLNIAEDIKLKMQQELGKQILSGDHGCDEWAMTFACNQCIEIIIAAEKELVQNRRMAECRPI